MVIARAMPTALCRFEPPLDLVLVRKFLPRSCASVVRTAVVAAIAFPIRFLTPLSTLRRLAGLFGGASTQNLVA